MTILEKLERNDKDDVELGLSQSLLEQKVKSYEVTRSFNRPSDSITTIIIGNVTGMFITAASGGSNINNIIRLTLVIGSLLIQVHSVLALLLTI